MYDWKKDKLDLYEREAFYSEMDGDTERQARMEELADEYRKEIRGEDIRPTAGV